MRNPSIYSFYFDSDLGSYLHLYLYPHAKWDLYDRPQHAHGYYVHASVNADVDDRVHVHVHVHDDTESEVLVPGMDLYSLLAVVYST